MEYTSYLFLKQELDTPVHRFRPGYLRIFFRIINEFCDNLLNVCVYRATHKRENIGILFATPAGVVLTRIADPATAQQVVGITTGMM